MVPLTTNLPRTEPLLSSYLSWLVCGGRYTVFRLSDEFIESNPSLHTNTA
jgi:hypothetical protein